MTFRVFNLNLKIYASLLSISLQFTLRFIIHLQYKYQPIHLGHQLWFGVQQPESVSPNLWNCGRLYAAAVQKETVKSTVYKVLFSIASLFDMVMYLWERINLNQIQTLLEEINFLVEEYHWTTIFPSLGDSSS